MKATACPAWPQARPFAARVGFALRRLLLSALAVAAVASAPASELSEYDLKAIYLYNFTQFVAWPAGARAPGTPVVIGLFGDDPFDGRLELIARRGQTDRPKIEVRKLNEIAEARACHVVFIGTSESRRLRAILAEVEGLPVLTVGDDDSHALRGSMVGFYVERGTVRIAINERAAARNGLTISSKLLRVARAL